MTSQSRQLIKSVSILSFPSSIFLYYYRWDFRKGKFHERIANSIRSIIYGFEDDTYLSRSLSSTEKMLSADKMKTREKKIRGWNIWSMMTKSTKHLSLEIHGTRTLFSLFSILLNLDACWNFFSRWPIIRERESIDKTNNKFILTKLQRLMEKNSKL